MDSLALLVFICTKEDGVIMLGKTGGSDGADSYQVQDNNNNGFS